MTAVLFLGLNMLKCAYMWVHMFKSAFQRSENRQFLEHGPLARYVKLWIVHAPGMPGTFSPPQRKPLVSDPGIHHGTCVTHVPWCMSGSLTRGGEENVPGIPGACAIRNFTHLVRGLLSHMLCGTSCPEDTGHLQFINPSAEIGVDLAIDNFLNIFSNKLCCDFCRTWVHCNEVT